MWAVHDLEAQEYDKEICILVALWQGSQITKMRLGTHLIYVSCSYPPPLPSRSIQLPRARHSDVVLVLALVLTPHVDLRAAELLHLGAEDVRQVAWRPRRAGARLSLVTQP